jgi:hypothetical protein
MFSDRLILGAGMHRFEKTNLDAFRRAVVDKRSGRALTKVLQGVRAGGYEIGGSTRKTVPRGFDAADERGEFLLHEGLFATYEGKARPVVKTPDFIDFCVEHFRAMWPISRWLLEEVNGKR